MRTLAALLPLCIAAVSVSASLTDGPKHTILWNEITAVAVVDSLVVAIGPGAVAVCRFDDTLGAFLPINLQFVDFDPVSLRSCDTSLLVRTSAHELVVYNRHRLPELVTAGTIPLATPFADYVLNGQDLYVSRWFDGIWKYHLDRLESPRLVDTTMAGMLVTQLEIRDDTLYALDKYNGVMRYDLTGPGVGTFIDFLWVPYDMTSFALAESLVVVASALTGVGLGEFGRDGSGIIDSLPTVTGAEKVLVADSYYVLLDRRNIAIVDRTDPGQALVTEIGNAGLDGDIFRRGAKEYVLLPRGGLALIDLDNPQSVASGLFRDGPITDLMLDNGYLYTCGGHNPVDVYRVDTTAAPTYSHTLFPNLNEVNSLERNGDTLIIAYARPNKVVFVADAADPDSFYIEGSVFFDDSTTSTIQFGRSRVDTVYPLLAVGDHSLQIYAVTDSSGIYSASTLKIVGRIAAALVHDTLLFVSTYKNQLWIYHLADDLSVEVRSRIDLASRCEEMMVIDERLVFFAWDEMGVMDVSDPAAPVTVSSVRLPGPVIDAVKIRDRLYTVGPAGIGIFSIDSLTLGLIEFGGQEGTMIDADGSVLAASDGGSIRFYHLSPEAQPTPQPELPADFALEQNYPNPFNSGTVIGYSLPATCRVKIVVYNILGQRVTTLVNREQPPGKYTVTWDATDHSGNPVASGVYFYRLTVGNQKATRKMMLVK